MTRLILLGPVIALVCVLPHALVHAADIVWDNDAGSNLWNVNQNWDGDVQPGIGDNAIVGAPAPTIVDSLEPIANLEVAPGGRIEVTLGALELLGGSATNEGSIAIGNNAVGISQIRFLAPGMLDGGGEIVLSRSDSGCCDRAALHADGGSVLHAATHTIRGEGRISGEWINDGIIRAEDTTGDATGSLHILGAMITNNHLIQSSPTAELWLNFADLTLAPGGRLIADTMPIYLAGVTNITGGKLESAGGGSYQNFSGNTSLTLDGVINDGQLNWSGSAGTATLFLATGGITNDGSITFDPDATGFSKFNVPAAGAILDGTGELILKRAGDRSQIEGGGVLTNGPNHTIRGVGNMISGLVNHGQVIAEPYNGNMLIVNEPQIINNGLMQAADGATLRFAVSTTVTQSPTGRIVAADGGTVELSSVSIIGGQLDTQGSGQIVLTETPTVTNVTNHGNVLVPGGSGLFVAGSSLVNNGLIEVNSSFHLKDNVLLSGTGSVDLNQPGFNSRITSDPDNVLTQALGHTIHGDGQLLTAGIINNGTIAGDSSTELIDIRTRLSGTGLLRNVVIGQLSGPSGGTHAPGLSTAIVPLEGVYTISSAGGARLEMELGGLVPGTEHDQLSSTGTVTLGGELDVSLFNGFIPEVGDRFTIIESLVNAIAGTFDQANLPTIVPDAVISWLPVEYNTHDVTLEVASVTLQPDGDFNNDGMYDCADIDALVTEIAEGTNSPSFDLTADGRVDLADRDAWLTAAGAANLSSGNPYLLGDANLDGTVDRLDFVEWNLHRFSSLASWCSGDFTADGFVDGRDLMVWNANKDIIAGRPAAVPEPEPSAIAIIGLLLLACQIVARR